MKLFKYLTLLCLVTVGLSLKAQKSTKLTFKEADYYEALDLYRKEKFNAAQQRFQITIKNISDPNNEIRIQSEYYNALCALKLFNRDAEHYMISFIEEHPDYPRMKEMYFHLGNLYFRGKKYDNAIKWYNQIDIYDLKQEDQSSFYFKRGYAYFQTGETQKAKSDFYEIKDGNDEYKEPGMYYYSHISYLNKNYQTSLTGFKSLDTSENFNPLAPSYIIQILYKQRKYDDVVAYGEDNIQRINPKKQQEYFYILGDAAYQTGQYRTATVYLKKYITLVKENNREISFQLGYAYHKIGETKAALEAFSECIAEPDSLSQLANYYIGDAFLVLDKKIAAKKSFYNAFNLSFDKDIQENSLLNYAKLSYETAESPFESAIDALKEYLKEFPNSSRREEVYNYLLNIYMTTNYYRLALESIDEIKNKDVRIKSAYQIIAYNYGVELFQNKNYDLAINKFKLVSKYPYNKDLRAKSKYWIAESIYHKKEYKNAAIAYKKFKNTPGAFNLSEYNLSNYNIGYCFYNVGSSSSYNTSLEWFRKFVQDPDEKDQRKINDAYLRIGDAYYMNRKYAEATEAYLNAQSIGLVGHDHAIFQLAMTYGYTGMIENKMHQLETLITDNFESDYYVDAKFELAETYRSINGKEVKALSLYNELIRDNTSHSFIEKAVLEAAMIENKLGRKEDAIDRLKEMVLTFTSKVSREKPLEFLENIYVELGRINEFEEWLTTVDGIESTMEDKQKRSFAEAEKFFIDEEYQIAKEKLNAYVHSYPGASNIYSAYYMLGESAIKTNDSLKATNAFVEIANKETNPYTEVASAYLASIFFNQRDYQSAIKYYVVVEKITQDIELKRKARTNLMFSYFNAKDYKGSIKYAGIVESSEGIDDNTKRQAIMIDAKSQFAIENYILASERFDYLAKTYPDRFGSEARYYHAEAHFHLHEIEKSEATLQKLFERKPSHEYWVVKGYILIADILMEQNDTIQAKLTLQSIIENYKGDELLAVSQAKYDDILMAEEEQKQRALKQIEEETAIQKQENDEFEEEVPEVKEKPEEGLEKINDQNINEVKEVNDEK